MNLDKTEQLKKTIEKIDTDKIKIFPEYPKSKTLKEIFNHSKRIIENSEKEDTEKLAVKVAYNLHTVVNKTNYIKDKSEKNRWLEISKELFENTIGYKE